MQKSMLNFCLLYLFGYCQLAPAFESNGWKDEDSSYDPVYTPYLRQKRFLPIFIAASAGLFAGVARSALTKVIRVNRWGRSIGVDHVSKINKMINYNMEGAMKLKNMLMKMDPHAGKMIEVSEKGFQCDEEFCRTRNGFYGLGLCTPHVCRCRDQQPKPLECKGGRVFDPNNVNCNYPVNLNVCGY